ncbi:hypothetical protein GCM10009799_44390 [Nocardiopsis rhodophaea]|uniref:Lipoprotein n=1 Tax=Nocardiopsis rhodophaea TaxID=280238 RepID=A0ABP5EXU6_9ACTN
MGSTKARLAAAIAIAASCASCTTPPDYAIRNDLDVPVDIWVSSTGRELPPPDIDDVPFKERAVVLPGDVEEQSLDLETHPWPFSLWRERCAKNENMFFAAITEDGRIYTSDTGLCEKGMWVITEDSAIDP